MYEMMRVWQAFHSGNCIPGFLLGEFLEGDIVAVNEEILKDKHMTECIC